MDKNSTSLTATQQMISSSVGALCVSLLATPFDVVKVRLQAQLKPTRKCFVFCNGLMDHVCYGGVPPAINEPIRCRIQGNVQSLRFSSTVDAFTKIVRYEGLSNLWKGLPPTMVMAVPQTVIYFTAYDYLKVKFGLVEGKQNIIAPMAAGVSSRFVAVTVISPLEMLRTKLQSRNGYQYNELASVLRNAIQQDGMLSLWRGLGPTLLRDVPFSALYWSGYELTKSRFEDPTIGVIFMAGATSGMLASILTNPFDVVKTHRQIDLGELGAGQHTKGMSSTISLVVKLCREQGFRSLYTGIVPRLVKVVPACAVMISTYEYGKQYFRYQNSKNSNFNDTKDSGRPAHDLM